MDRTFGQHLHRLLMADKDGEFGRHPGQDRIGGTLFGHPAQDRADRLAITRLRHRRAKVMGQNADAIAAAHEGVIAGHHLGHQAKDRRLDPRLGGAFLFRRVGHAAGATADEDPGIV